MKTITAKIISNINKRLLYALGDQYDKFKFMPTVNYMAFTKLYIEQCIRDEYSDSIPIIVWTKDTDKLKTMDNIICGYNYYKINNNKPIDKQIFLDCGEFTSDLILVNHGSIYVEDILKLFYNGIQNEYTLNYTAIKYYINILSLGIFLYTWIIYSKKL